MLPSNSSIVGAAGPEDWIREISAEMLSEASGLPTEKVKEIFCNEVGFQTPKLDCRAAIFKGDKILLVQENNKTWSLPGGWVDVDQSVKQNTIKEVKEEVENHSHNLETEENKDELHLIHFPQIKITFDELFEEID